jgi:hypothetical protein
MAKSSKRVLRSVSPGSFRWEDSEPASDDMRASYLLINGPRLHESVGQKCGEDQV